MTDEIEGQAVLTTIDAWAVVRDLSVYSKYSAADLYRRYERQARDRGQQPASPMALGLKLRHLGMTKCRMRPRGSRKVVHAWMATHTAVDPRWGSGEWP